MATSEILIVEDEGIVALEILNRLKRLGYNVLGVVSSGEQAIEQVKLRRPDLVLMDIHLDGKMDGIQTAEVIRKQFNTPVIYVTAHADKGTLQRAKLTDPFGYIVKPFQEIELRGTIEIALYKHKLEEKLIESERWLSTTLKSIGDAAIATDAEGRISFMNPVAEELTGWQQQDALGVNLSTVFHIINEKTGAVVENPVTKVLRKGNIVGLANHTLLVAKDGREIPIDDSAAPIKDSQGNIIGVILIFHDVTERRKAEIEMEKYTAEIESRNEELDALTYTLAHGFKNVLSNITSSTSALKSGLKTMPEEESMAHLETLSRTVRKMSSMVDELLVMSEVRTTEFQREPLDMGQIVHRAQQRLSHTINLHQAQITTPETWPQVLGHGKWVEEIWFNYISNAIKYGGKPPRVEIGAETQPDGMVKFWIRDNGPGIPQEDKARIFTPHVRLGKEGISGHGLGLTLVRRIVHRLGGQIEMTNGDKKGSVFSFTLPGEEIESN